MTNAIIPKKSTVPGKVPATTDLQTGEIAVNLSDKIIYTKDASGAIVSIGAGGSGGGSNGPIAETNQSLTTSYTMSAGKNGMAVGPFSVANGAQLTIPTGAVFKVI